MATVTREGLTLEQFLKLPETKPALEYIEGKVVQKAMPKARHSQTQCMLCERLNNAFACPSRSFLAGCGCRRYQRTILEASSRQWNVTEVSCTWLGQLPDDSLYDDLPKPCDYLCTNIRASTAPESRKARTRRSSGASSQAAG